ncbi:MAG: type II secretion system F family protein, partial [Myxococcota bacterium]|nr:type II secretion system F family protein [Myxococcota bacterium]
MPVFAYEGKNSAGEVKKGDLEAASPDEARQKLRTMQIQATSVKKKGAGGINIKMPEFFKPKVETKDLVIFVRQFATMIDSGLPLVQCLDIQARQAANPTFREQLAVIKESVESGSTFADSLKKFPETFDEMFQNLVRAGEVGGILDTILNRLATSLEKAEKLKRQIKGAMSYPRTVMIVAGVVVSILLVKVVPTFEEMFAEFGSNLPAPTQFVVDLSEWLQANIMFCLAGMAGIYFALKAIGKTKKGRVVFDHMSL